MTPTRGDARFLDRLLDTAVTAARAGGAVLMEGLDRPKEVQQKGARTSIVTWADVTSQAAILRIVGEAFPAHAVIAEEGDHATTSAEYTWLVDPLDGTSNYAHGLPFSCVSVAVRDGAHVVAGAIFEPLRGELFTATKGGGAWLGGRRLAVSDAVTLDRALVGTGIQSDDAAQLAAYGRRVVALHTTARNVRALGSPALALAYVAAGRFDAFLERAGTFAWDVAAGSLLITEAGGQCDDIDGGALNLGVGVANVLGSNGHIHAALHALVGAVDGP